MLPTSTFFSVTTPSNGAVISAYDAPTVAAAQAGARRLGSGFGLADAASAPAALRLGLAQAAHRLVELVGRGRVLGAQFGHALVRGRRQRETGQRRVAIGRGRLHALLGGGQPGLGAARAGPAGRARRGG